MAWKKVKFAYEDTKDKGTIVGLFNKKWVSVDKKSYLEEIKRRNIALKKNQKRFGI
jgi:hypothetical protein